ncbi:MAG: TonB-dependent receptor [Acidobacteriota bacterium]
MWDRQRHLDWLVWRLNTGLCCALLALGGVARSSDQDLTALSLEELMNVEVVSVSRKAERLADTAAAVFVITADDIRRSGATSLAESLRLAPGLSVGRVGASQWAISARGLSNLFADHLLVLVDGRTVFTPLFSGVYWDIQDYPLEDIARIEVIRGPGGTMWGANAVNGVINIITKRSEETQGAMASATSGTVEPYVAAFRYGGHLTATTTYRAYVKGREIDSFKLAGGADAHDQAEMLQGGIRIDGTRNELTWNVLADIYSGEFGSAAPRAIFLPPSIDRSPRTTDVNGGNVLLRVGMDKGAEGSWALQSYFDQHRREDIPFGSKIKTMDLDWQQRLPWSTRNELVWGLGFRHIDIETRGSFSLRLGPETPRLTQSSVFAQNETRWLDGKWRLILGSKFEHFESSGWQVQPSLRAVWHPSAGQILWGAASSAVHTPSLAQLAVEINGWVDPNGAPPVLSSIRGGRDLKAVRAVAYELGYRWQPHAHVALSASASTTRYRDMLTTISGAPELRFTPFVYVDVPVSIVNSDPGTVRAFELEADVQLTRALRLRSSYSYLDPETPLARAGITDDPSHQFVVRSSLTLGKGVETDVALRRVSSLHVIGIDAYTELDLRLGWKQSDHLELAVVGHNLLADQHPEFADRVLNATTQEIPRSISLSVVWKTR